MKRLHVHMNVSNLDESVKFYQALFASKPTVLKNDYAKWDLENPAVNFAISDKGVAGVQHLGIEAADKEELGQLYQRLLDIDAPKVEEGETVCCYARSEKSWINDPQDISWELFHTLHAEEHYYKEADISNAYPQSVACCQAGSRCC